MKNTVSLISCCSPYMNRVSEFGLDPAANTPTYDESTKRRNQLPARKDFEQSDASSHSSPTSAVKRAPRRIQKASHGALGRFTADIPADDRPLRHCVSVGRDRNRL